MILTETNPVMYKKLISEKRDFVLQNARFLCKNAEDAEDLCQDVLILAIKNQDKFDGKNINAWLYTLTKNLFINKYRKAQKTPLTELPKTEGFGDTVSNTGEFSWLIEYTDNVLSTLPQAMKDVIKLRMNGFNYEESAKKLNIPTGTVRSLLHRARIQISTQFPGYSIKQRKHNKRK